MRQDVGEGQPTAQIEPVPLIQLDRDSVPKERVIGRPGTVLPGLAVGWLAIVRTHCALSGKPCADKQHDNAEKGELELWLAVIEPRHRDMDVRDGGGWRTRSTE